MARNRPFDAHRTKWAWGSHAAPTTVHKAQRLSRSTLDFSHLHIFTVHLGQHAKRPNSPPKQAACPSQKHIGTCQFPWCGRDTKNPLSPELAKATAPLAVLPPRGHQGHSELRCMPRPSSPPPHRPPPGLCIAASGYSAGLPPGL